MNKNYQMNDAAAMGLAVPESVTSAMTELAGDVQEDLIAMAVGTGLQRAHPGATASPREGLAETPTVVCLGVSPTRARTQRKTKQHRVDDVGPVRHDDNVIAA